MARRRGCAGRGGVDPRNWGFAQKKRERPKTHIHEERQIDRTDYGSPSRGGGGVVHVGSEMVLTV